VRVVGTAIEDLTSEQFRELARSSCEHFGLHKLDPEQWATFADRLSYVPLSAGPEGLASAVKSAAESLGPGTRLLHYLSVPPKAASAVITMLRDADLAEDSRVVMEKPFGNDLATAIELNDFVHEVFDESQIFRIDHFLGKEAAQNILAFRFANGLFEPIWNRDHIDHVQIDVPETLSLDARVGFYETTGAYRDMVVTHLFQVLAFMAMEPPTSLQPGPISDEKLKVFRSMKPIEPHDVVRGQYSGYRGKEEVADYSDTETFVALKIEIDNWRWAGVPFFLRAGKALPVRATEIRVIFKRPPKLAITTFTPDANELVLRIDPQPGTDMVIQAKEPGANRTRSVDLSLIFSKELGDAPEPYERLLSDAMRGDSAQFAREDGVEETWRIVQPLLDKPPAVQPYEVGSWGPADAAKLCAGQPSWREPWLES
jgi:glucose-6-phosphate 1-dehydrogenase